MLLLLSVFSPSLKDYPPPPHLQVQRRRDPLQPNGHRVRQKDDIRAKNCRAADPAYWGEWQQKEPILAQRHASAVVFVFLFFLPSAWQASYVKTTTCQTSQRDGEFDPEMSRAAYFRAHPLICVVTFDRWCLLYWLLVCSDTALTRCLWVRPEMQIRGNFSNKCKSYLVVDCIYFYSFIFFLLVINQGFKL